MHDDVNHPPHYTGHPSGVECITITEHMNFCLGQAMRLIWICDAKGDPIRNLEKARWYIDREIARRKGDTLQEEIDVDYKRVLAGKEPDLELGDGDVLVVKESLF